MSLARCVVARARRSPGRPAVLGAGQRLTYAQLAARASGCAEVIRSRAVTGPIALAIADPVDLVVGILGLELAGVVAAVFDARWPRKVEAAAGAEVGSGLVLRDGDEALRAPAALLEPGPGDVRWFGFTSGSQGPPKPILRRRNSWLASFEPVARLFGVGGCDRVLLPGPLSSSLYLFGALHALWAGACCLLDETDRADATVVHCVPALLPRLFGVPLAICGGAEPPAELVARSAVEGTRVIEYYGASELSLVAWREPGGGLQPFPGVEIEIRAGEIWVRSAYLAENLTRRDQRGFATVGDHGHLDEHGRLTVSGRGEGLILTAGATVLPEEVERVLRTLPGVADAVVLGMPHPRLGSVVTAVVERVPGAPADVAGWRRAARERLRAAARPRRWHVVASLPRTASGKPARREVRDVLPAGVP